MWHCSNAHHRPSLIIESTTSPLPMRRPSRTRGRRYGQLLIDSMPPATATSMSPTRMPWSASMTAFNPDPQTLLIVSAATRSGSPPWSAAWRAGFCPRPAETTLPMMHSSTIPGSMPARRTASAMASAPSCGAVNPFSAPRNLPVGVRTAETITDSRTTHLDALDDVGAEQRLETPQDHRRRSHHFCRPLQAGGFDEQHAAFELDARDAIEGRADRRLPREGHLAVRQRRAAQQLDERTGKPGGDGKHRNQELGIKNDECAENASNQ